jgi:hypothetical protein
MLGQTQSPLVSGERSLRAMGLRLRWQASLVGGLLVGSLVTFGGASLLGLALGARGLPLADRVLGLVGLSLVLVAFDFDALLRRTSLLLGLRRQTPQRLGLDLRRADMTALLWGLDIGTGVTTFRVTSAVWLCLCGALFQLVPAEIGLAYGLGISAALLLWIYTRGSGPILPRIDRIRTIVRGVHLLYIGAVTVFVVVALWR